MSSYSLGNRTNERLHWESVTNPSNKRDKGTSQGRSGFTHGRSKPVVYGTPSRPPLLSINIETLIDSTYGPGQLSRVISVFRFASEDV